MITYEKMNKSSQHRCWGKIGREMSKVVAMLSVGITLSLGSGTAHAEDSLVITAPPPNVQTRYVDRYVSAKYIKIEKYNVHILWLVHSERLVYARDAYCD